MGRLLKRLTLHPDGHTGGLNGWGCGETRFKLHLCDRICGICGVHHALVFAQAVEQIADIEVPDRAYYVRTIIAEFERIQSHILWAGVAAHELGFDTLFYLAWQIREESVDVIEYITGNRVNYGIMMLGGTRRDITADMFPRLEQALQYYEGLLEKMVNLFLNDKTIAMRCKDTGILTKRRALELATVGPTSRASGLAMDVRIDSPYAAYGDLDFDIVLPDVYNSEGNGDVYDRIIVRIFEIKQSIDIIRQCMKQMPEGPVLAEEKYAKLLMNLKKASGEAFARVEAPRGEDMHYVRMNGKQEAPEMWKVKASTYSNQMAWVEILQGEQIADIPIIVASIDPCMSCTDRVAVVGQDGNAGIMTKEHLHRLSVEKTRRLQS